MYNLCQQMDLDKKDLLAFFQEMRLFFGKSLMEKTETSDIVESLDYLDLLGMKLHTLFLMLTSH